MANTPDTPDLAMADPISGHAERRSRVLWELAEFGMELARAVQARALTPGVDAAITQDLILSFTRIARAVRQTIALEARIERDARTSASEGAERLTRADRERRHDHKTRVGRLVERAIDTDTEASGEEADDLYADLHERLEDADDLAGFADRPVSEIVAHICRELGVAPPPALWDEADWGAAGGGASGPLQISSAPEAEPGTGRADAAWPEQTAGPRKRSP
jgi:hypothetical protein